MTLDLEHLQLWIGREDENEEHLSVAHVARFNATLDNEILLVEGDEAPQLIHFCVAQPVVPSASLGQDGHPERGDFLPPVPLPRRMWAGGEIQFHAPIRVGEVVKRRSVVEDVRVKQGRSGALCFVTVRHHIRSANRDAVTERQDIVYRGAPPESDAPVDVPASAEPASVGQHYRSIETTASLLFRYSAVTFNTHRIHYDRDYAREVEQYAGLVLHGPLQATLLTKFAAELRGASLRSFTFRSFSPIFDTAPFTLNAEEVTGGLRLWTAQEQGPVAMEALARW